MSTHSSPAAARRRGDLWFALGTVVALAVLAWVVITVQGLAHDLRTANDARDALARQVQTLGHKPVAGPPGSRGEPGKTVVGPRGPRGPAGASGKPAPTITPSPGPSGASGAPGVPGAAVTGPAGPSGAPGADSSVPGPSGPPGPQGEQGPAGRDGKDAQSCPDGYSWQTPDYDPDAKVCRRDSTPAPSPSDNPSPQAAALDPRRKTP